MLRCEQVAYVKLIDLCEWFKQESQLICMEAGAGTVATLKRTYC